MHQRINRVNWPFALVTLPALAVSAYLAYRFLIVVYGIIAAVTAVAGEVGSL